MAANNNVAEEFTRLVEFVANKKVVDEKIKKLHLMMSLHNSTSSTSLSRVGGTRRHSSTEVGQVHHDMNTLTIALDEYKAESENLKTTIAEAEGRLLGVQELITVNTRVELDLLRSLRRRGIYQGNVVRCMPFASRKKMKSLAKECSGEFTLELISEDTLVEQVITAVVDATISATMASTNSGETKVTDLTSTSGTSKDEDDNDNDG